MRFGGGFRGPDLGLAFAPMWADRGYGYYPRVNPIGLGIVVLIMLIIVVIAVVGSLQGAHKFVSSAAGSPDHQYAITVWWSPYQSLPSWTNYSFGSSTTSIPAISSATLRLRRDGRLTTGLFVGTGNDHENLLLTAKDPGSAIPLDQANFVPPPLVNGPPTTTSPDGYYALNTGPTSPANGFNNPIWDSYDATNMGAYSFRWSTTPNSTSDTNNADPPLTWVDRWFGRKKTRPSNVNAGITVPLTLVDGIMWSGLSALPKTAGGRGNTYSCVSFGPDGGQDTLLIGRDDGIWMAVPKTFSSLTSGRTSYDLTRIIAAPSGMVPLQFYVTAAIDPGNTWFSDSTNVVMEPVNSGRIWPSFFIPPASIVISDISIGGTTKSYAVVKTDALGTPVTVDGATYYNDRGRYTSNSKALAVSVGLDQETYTLDTSSYAAQACQRAVVTPRTAPWNTANIMLSGNSFAVNVNEEALPWSLEWRSQQRNGLKQNFETVNDLETRKHVAAAYKKTNQALVNDAYMRAILYPVIIYHTHVAPLNPGVLDTQHTAKTLLADAHVNRLLVSWSGANATAIYAAYGDENPTTVTVSGNLTNNSFLTVNTPTPVNQLLIGPLSITGKLPAHATLIIVGQTPPRITRG